MSQTTVAGSFITLNTIDSDHYVDGSIDLAHIGANQIDGTKLVLASQAAGDIMYYNGTDWIRLAKGTADQVLTMNDGATAPNWEAAAAGGIASVVADTTPQLGGNLDMQARLLVGNAGSTGIAISSAGEVNMAAQPSFGVHASTGQTNVTGSSQMHTVEWDELWDVGANFSSDVFTAPVAGKYFMIAHIDIDGIAGSGGHNTIGVWFRTVGGSAIAHYFDLFAFRYNTSFPATCVLDLAANDVIRVEIEGSGASGGQTLDVLYDSGAKRCHWMGMLLG